MTINGRIRVLCQVCCTVTVSAFPGLIGALQGSDVWDAEFLDKFIDTLVANVALLAEEAMP
jgi:hypothetical protein